MEFSSLDVFEVALRSDGTRRLFELGEVFAPRLNVHGTPLPFRVEPEQQAEIEQAMGRIRKVLHSQRAIPAPATPGRPRRR